jgi:hypothetical protein
MNGEAIVSISAAVVALTQLVKWAGLPDAYGPLSVLALSLFGTAFWGWSQSDFTRMTAFTYFAGWIAVSTSAAGVFGFTRAAVSGVSRMTPPPGGGAGSSPTQKP